MNYDIAIIGAGPAGLALTRRLMDLDLSIVLLDQQSDDSLENPPVDGRDIALTHLSVRLLSDLGVWQHIPEAKISPIHEAQVMEGDSPYTLKFDCKDEPYDSLGYLVSNHLIRKGLFDAAMQNEKATLMTNAKVKNVVTDEKGANIFLQDGKLIKASLVVGADTRFSETRRQMGIPTDMHDFGRVAIVCWMEHEKSHENIALECFHYGHTLAVLPMPENISSIVITVPADKAAEILEMDNKRFEEEVQCRLKSKLGKMTLVGQRYSYPLVAVHARRFYTNRYVLLGDAAVGMHPVTAHGFNLGLSGADILGEELISAATRGEDIAGEMALSRYQRRHMMVTRPLFTGTNQIVNLFTNEALPARLARKAALRVSNHMPPVKWAIKRKLTTQSHGYGMVLPFLAS